MNPRQMTMVVARYNENVDWLRQVPWNYVVYNKDGSLPEWVKNEIKLPNIGHEAHTYLTYIVNNYDNLSDYTVFVQGNPFDHSRNFIKKINDFDGGADFFPLSNEISAVSGYEISDWFGSKVTEWAQKFFLKNDIKFFEYPNGAQFIVSKKAIRFHAKETYQKMLNSLTEAASSGEEDIFNINPAAMGKEVVIFRMFSEKFPRGRSFIVPKTAMSFHDKLTRQKIRDFLEDRILFSVWMMEFIWKILFDGEHKTVYD